MDENRSVTNDSDSVRAVKPVTWTNALTLLGLFLVGVGILLLLTFWLFRLVSPAHADTEYTNIIGFLVLPGVLVSGMILCPIGIAIRRWRYRRYGVSRHIPVKAALIFLAASFFLVLPVLGVSGYYGYHYTESSEFCGSCHSVMSPHYTAYTESPHSRVSCAVCHIGPGASPFVKSKLSGVRQVFATALNTYPRPIPTAIKHLRPARETCEECHWPEKFVGWSLKRLVRYGHQEDNPRHEFEVLIKVGGEHPRLNVAEGIHMHMVGTVRYVATDEMLQTIPWVEYTRRDGTKEVFRSDGRAESDPPPTGMMRNLDCIDCHNRAGHQFHAPQDAVDAALDARQIDDSLPYIKLQAVVALSADYADKAAALEGIETAIVGFYEDRYPDVWSAREQDVRNAVAVLQDIYQRDFFPYMNVTWRTYPNNIGHLYWPGCFRCHDGLHVNDRDEAVVSKCDTCHTFLNRQPGTNVILEGDFEHEMKIHERWGDFGPHRNMLCHDCHSGGTRAYGEEITDAKHCGNCHPSGRWLEMERGVRFIEKPSATTAPAPAS